MFRVIAFLVFLSSALNLNSFCCCVSKEIKSELQRLIDQKDPFREDQLVDEGEPGRFSELSVDLSKVPQTKEEFVHYKLSHGRPHRVVEKARLVKELFAEFHNILPEERLGDDGKTPHWNASRSYRFAGLEAFCKHYKIKLKDIHVFIFFEPA